jgi:hypothetical protein
MKRNTARGGIDPRIEIATMSRLTRADLRKQLNEWSRWDSLRKLGSSPLVRSSLAFAAAGYLLLWNSKFQDFLTVKFDAHFSLWRIWMIYYGGICLAVATGLYS